MYNILDIMYFVCYYMSINKHIIIEEDTYMSYNSKQAIASISAGIVTLALYIIFALRGSAPFIGTLSDLRNWAQLMLMTIGIGIVFQIIAQIVFRCVVAAGIAIREGCEDDARIEREIESSDFEDERTTMVNRKASQTTMIVLGIGLVAALIALVRGSSAIVALNIIFLSAAVGNIAEGVAQIFCYEGGN